MSDEYKIINRDRVESAWTGKPVSLVPGKSVHMSQTPIGPLVFVYRNSSEKDQVTLMLTSSGSVPMPITIQPGARLPGVYIHDWGGAELDVTNISATPSANVWISASGVMPGAAYEELPWDKHVDFPSQHAARISPVQGLQQLIMQVTSSDQALIAIIGRGSDGGKTTARVLALNAPRNTGPGTEKEAPPGYYSTTTAVNSSYEFLVVTPDGDTTEPLYVMNVSQTEVTVKVFVRRL